MSIEALKPQDVFVACQLALVGQENATHEWLSKKLHLSLSTVFEAIKRCRQAKLVVGPDKKAEVVKLRLYDFLVHAVPVLYYQRKVAPVRGIPTATFSPTFRDRFTKPGDLITVWPYSKGKEMGEGLLPFYPTIPLACSQNQALYHLMSAIEVLRVGKLREREAAIVYLRETFGLSSSSQKVTENDRCKCQAA
jgi:hypothetical protein